MPFFRLIPRIELLSLSAMNISSTSLPTLNPEGWLVHLEAETKDKTGPITYVIDGKIEGLAFHNRSITGTWKGRGESGPFKISRQ